MTAFTWWIDEPLVRGCSNPTDEDLARFRAEGASIAVSLLEENRQPPRYNRTSAQAAGWSIYSIPIEEGSAPSLDQIGEFITHLKRLPQGTRVAVFCESGLGRTAFIGAVYWITKGLTASQAITYVNEACEATDWVTADRRRALEEYERLQAP